MRKIVKIKKIQDNKPLVNNFAPRVIVNINNIGQNRLCEDDQEILIFLLRWIRQLKLFLLGFGNRFKLSTNKYYVCQYFALFKLWKTILINILDIKIV
jgi:hypothetical protein